MKPRLVLAAMLILFGCGFVAAQGWEVSQYEANGRKSGYLYMDPATRGMQDDDFQNPGMFAVDNGATLWTREVDGKSCAGCHGDAANSMKGVAARYPVFDEATGSLVNLELRINQMLTAEMGTDPLPYESPDLLALTAYVANQSRGMPMDVAVDGPAAPFFEQGKAFYYTRRGQLDLSCAQCHEERAGMRLRGDVMSEGQVNGFPIFRLLWNSVGSRHHMFQWCNTSVRAEPYPLGSPEYLALELYVAWRGNGLPIEAPAVRR